MMSSRPMTLLPPPTPPGQFPPGVILLRPPPPPHRPPTHPLFCVFCPRRLSPMSPASPSGDSTPFISSSSATMRMYRRIPNRRKTQRTCIFAYGVYEKVHTLQLQADVMQILLPESPKQASILQMKRPT